MESRVARVVAALVAGVIVVAGCRGGERDFPTGQWTYDTGRAEGKSIADFRPDGTWELTQGPSKKSGEMTQISTGLYSTTDETLTFEADSRCEALHYQIDRGTYAWTLERGHLTLTPLDEPCVERRAALGGRVFEQVKGTNGT